MPPRIALFRISVSLGPFFVASNRNLRYRCPYLSAVAMSGLSSHGRGGAGNMKDAAKSPQLMPTDLETPTLKKPIVTTGRGGTGNMAKNTDPTETRLRQDVNA